MAKSGVMHTVQSKDAVLHREDFPRVAVDSMNQVHDEDVDLLNALVQLCRQAAHEAASHAELNVRLDEFLVHIREHFDREEAHMLNYGFPPYPVHKGEHDRVYAELSAIVDRWRDTGDLELLTAYLSQTLPAWMATHISTMDLVTAAFLHQAGLD